MAAAAGVVGRSVPFPTLESPLPDTGPSAMSATVKMLVADDSSTVHAFFDGIARRSPVAVEIMRAVNGRECMEALCGGGMDLAFIDVHMPEMSGMEAVAFERFSSNPIKTFVTLMSAGGASAPKLEMARQLKVYEFLTKPFSAIAIVDILQTYQRISAPTRALIVDDSATVRRVIEKVLKASIFRIECEQAKDGADAIARCQAEPFQIIFLDYNMPGLNGAETLDKILTAKPQAKVIMMSAQRDEMRRILAKKRGALDFLYKPFNSTDVDRLLHVVFDIRMPSME